MGWNFGVVLCPRFARVLYGFVVIIGLNYKKLYKIKVIKTFISHKTSHIKNVC